MKDQTWTPKRVPAALYGRHVQPQLPDAMVVEYLQLPSTSPANATVPRAEKLRAWKAIKS